MGTLTLSRQPWDGVIWKKDGATWRPKQTSDVMRYLLIIEPYNIVEEVGKRVACKGTSLVIYHKIFVPHMHYY